MERFTFLLASSAFCLFVTVALSSAMTADCLCDSLPGNECQECGHQSLRETFIQRDSSALVNQYRLALQKEHEEFHRTWVERNREFHASAHTPEEEAQFLKGMEEAQAQFHEMTGISASGETL